tara:strand:- start:1678 stop:2187 length:510 start_codon:yes stop_codon:yes gene_type:complete
MEMKQQKVGDIVPIGADIYMIEKIANGIVYMRQPNARGKSKQMYWREVPYFEDGKLVIPDMKKKPKTVNTRIHLGSFFKGGTSKQVSREFIAYSKEWIDDLLHRILDDCVMNAEAKGHSRLMPAHFRPIHYIHDRPYFNPANDDYALKESIWYEEDEANYERREEKDGE